MTEKEPNAEKDDVSKVEKRARWEAFEFRVPCEGSVRVENVSYGHESDDHTHVITVEHGCATDCTCTYSQYNDVCKHMLAVDGTTAVIIAATPEIEVESDEPAPLPVATESRYQPRTRLVSENGTVDKIHPREFAKKVNQETGEFSLLNTIDNDEDGPQPYAAAGYGPNESTGVQDLG